MNTKMRSEFYICNCGVLHWAGTNNCIDPFDESDANCVKRHDATNVEVIVAWLQASDERRREIEIVSRPTKAGEYCRYRLGVRETIETWIVNVETDAEAQEIRDSEGRGLWEPLT